MLTWDTKTPSSSLTQICTSTKLRAHLAHPSFHPKCDLKPVHKTTSSAWEVRFPLVSSVHSFLRLEWRNLIEFSCCQMNLHASIYMHASVGGGSPGWPPKLCFTPFSQGLNAHRIHRLALQHAHALLGISSLPSPLFRALFASVVNITELSSHKTRLNVAPPCRPARPLPRPPCPNNLPEWVDTDAPKWPAWTILHGCPHDRNEGTRES